MYLVAEERIEDDVVEFARLHRCRGICERWVRLDGAIPNETEHDQYTLNTLVSAVVSSIKLYLRYPRK